MSVFDVGTFAVSISCGRETGDGYLCSIDDGPTANGADHLLQMSIVSGAAFPEAGQGG